MKCYIFCAAEIDDYSFLDGIDLSEGFVICADGGYVHAKMLGIVPDVWLGDGDSLKISGICAKEKLKFPVEKDNTDTDLAVELAIKRGYDEIIILGGLGGRLDHEYSHFCLLKKILESGCRGMLLSEKNEITMENKNFVLYPNDKEHISFFPFGGDVTDFSVKGLKYEANGICLSSSKVQASSNRFDKANRAEISFSSGCVLVIRSND